MNFQRRRKKREMHLIRLPLVALIDVVLFMLMYFIMAGTLSGSEANLSSALGADRRGGGTGQKLAAQIVDVVPEGARTVFKIGARVLTDRESLAAVVGKLPLEAGIIVRVSDRAPVSAAATALQVVRDAGFRRVSYVPGP